MSNAARRMSWLRRDLHNLKTRIRNRAHPDDPEWYIEEINKILSADQDRIGRTDL